jgi:4-amino-4-deoxychorismate lyase
MSLPLPADHARFRASGIRARICALRVSAQPALAGIKHLNRLENVLARREWGDPDIAEGILLDSDGNVIGGTMTNIFIAENGALTTPDLRLSGVAGVTRERIFARAAASGIACRVENISTERLLESDEAFVVNSVIGVWQIRALADKSWDSGTITECVRRWLDEEID